MKKFYPLLIVLFTAIHLFSQTTMREYQAGHALNYSNIINYGPNSFGYAAQAISKENIGSVFIATFNRSLQPNWYKFYTDSVHIPGVHEQRITACWNGGFAIAFEPTSRDGYVYVLKTSNTGKLLWSKRYNLLSGFGSTVLLARPKGNIIILATRSIVTTNGPVILSVNGDNGHIEWCNLLTIAHRGSYIPMSIAPTKDSGFVVAGSNDEYNTLFVSRFNKSDSLVWTRRFQVPPQGSYYSQSVGEIIETNDGGFAFTGSIPSSVAGNGYDLSLVKLNKDGNLQWAKQMGTTGEDDGSSIVQNSDSSYTVGASSYTAGADLSGKSELIKFTKTGEATLFQRVLDTGYNWSSSIIQDNSGRYIMSGTLEGGRHSQAVGFLATFENNGISCTGTFLHQAVSDLPISKISGSGELVAAQAISDTIYFKETNPGIFARDICTDSSAMYQTNNVSQLQDKTTTLKAEVLNNPVKTNLQLKLSGGKLSSKWLITINNMQGRVMLHQNIRGASALQHIDVSAWEVGLYILNVTNYNWHQSIKLVVVK